MLAVYGQEPSFCRACTCKLSFPPCCIATNHHQNMNKNVELEHNDTCWDVKYGSAIDDWPGLCLETVGLLQHNHLRAAALKYYLLRSKVLLPER